MTSGRDVPVIVGSGLAGLTVAHALSPRQCIVVTPGMLTDGAASMLAQGGIAAAMASDDSPTLHAEDTYAAGAFVGDMDTIVRITDAAPGVIALLDGLGVPFDRDGNGEIALALEGGHRRHRIVHAGDHSGATVTSTVASLVADLDSVEVISGHTARSLVQDDSGAVSGVVIVDSQGQERTLLTSTVILATGGLGGLFPQTTNPLGALGQGVAMAARAGARVDDLHLVQFHPTGLDVGRDPMPLLTEALRGAGAILLANGERFVDELQPRDIVARAVWQQRQSGASVQLDARAISDVTTRFPSVAALCAESGLNLATDLLPVCPTLHYSMGGVSVDARARSTVPGLYAVGECSRTGLHGANRLASNSLLEAVVTGQAVAQDLADGDGSTWSASVEPVDPTRVVPASQRGRDELPLARVREILGQSCGVVRDAPSLASAIAALEPHRGEDAAYMGWLIASAALDHPHSVGAHFRSDDTSVRAEAVA